MIGALRNSVEIQKPVAVTDAVGGRSVTWTKVRTAWASIQPTSASESIVNDGQQHVTTHAVRLRYVGDIKPDWRLVFGSRVLEIESMQNDRERGRWLDLLCLEKHA